MRIEIGDRVKIVGKKATGDRFGWTSSMDGCKVGQVIGIDQVDVFLDDPDLIFPRRYVIADLEKINKGVDLMNTFDNFEIMPVILIGRMPDGTEEVEALLESDLTPEDKIFAWTVYGHLPEGGVEALADCPTKEVAEFVYHALMQTYPKHQEEEKNDLVGKSRT